jgi:hypothetical protein
MNEKTHVLLPTERIDEAMLSCTVPGFYGELRIELSILKEAARGVNLRIERHAVTQTMSTKSDVGILSANDRVSKARQDFSPFGSKLRLECPLPTLVLKFRDGFLSSIEQVGVSVARVSA